MPFGAKPGVKSRYALPENPADGRTADMQSVVGLSNLFPRSPVALELKGLRPDAGVPNLVPQDAGGYAFRTS
jgi:hypothetical protein